MSLSEDIPLKKCTKCEIEKPLNQFHKSTNSKKSSYHCKSCISIRDKERYARCREEVITWTKQMYSGDELDFQLSLVATLNQAEIRALRSKLNKILDTKPKFDVVQYKKEYYLKNKEDINLKGKAYYEANKDKYLEWSRKWRQANPEKARMRVVEWGRTNFLQRKITGAKVRAKKAGIPFDLKKEDLVVPDFCPILGIPLFLSDTGSKCANSPSLDRIIQEKGYVKDNVQIISDKANTMKNDANPVELLLFAWWVLNTFDPDVYLKGETIEETLL